MGLEGGEGWGGGRGVGRKEREGKKGKQETETKGAEKKAAGREVKLGM